MKKFTDIASTAIMILVIIFAFLLVGMQLFGLKPYAVISGSMRPTYQVGSLIYVKKVTAAELEVGDPITYMLSNGVVVTHRIIEIHPDEDNPTVVRYTTKGDANNTADGTPVHINNIIGKPVFSIPLLGFVAYFVQTPPGSYILLSCLLILLMLSFIPNIVEVLKTQKKIEATNELIKKATDIQIPDITGKDNREDEKKDVQESEAASDEHPETK